MVAQLAGGDIKHVALFGLILRLNIAIPLVKKAWLHLNVEHMVFIAFILACMSSQFRLAVVQLQLACHLGWQLTYNLVATKQVLAIHHQAYGFVVPVEFAVTVLHSWQLFDEFVETCPLLQLECFGIEHNGVARHRDARHLCCHLHLLQHKSRRLQLNDAKVSGVLHVRTVGIVHLACILISDHAEREHGATFPTNIEKEASGAVSLSLILHRPSWLWINLASYCRSNKYLARLGINYLTLERVGMTHSRLHKAEQ